MKRAELPTIDVRKYGGKQVAILDGAIIAVGQTLKEVLEQVKSRAPARPLEEVKIFAVPRSLSVIYYAADFPVRHYTSARRKASAFSRG